MNQSLPPAGNFTPKTKKELKGTKAQLLSIILYIEREVEEAKDKEEAKTKKELKEETVGDSSGILNTPKTKKELKAFAFAV